MIKWLLMMFCSIHRLVPYKGDIRWRKRILWQIKTNTENCSQKLCRLRETMENTGKYGLSQTPFLWPRKAPEEEIEWGKESFLYFLTFLYFFLNLFKFCTSVSNLDNLFSAYFIPLARIPCEFKIDLLDFSILTWFQFMSSSIFLSPYRNLLSYLGFFTFYQSNFCGFFLLLCLLFSLSYFFLMELLYFFPVFFKLIEFLHESYIIFPDVHLGNSHGQAFLQ